MKKLIAMLLTLVLLLTLPLSAVSLAEPAIETIAPVVYSHDDRVTLIDGACVDTPVNDMTDAAAVVNDVLKDLGGDERTELIPWRTLTDAFGNQYYVFQQMYNNTTVLGGAIKVITNAEGAMIGLTSSIVSDLPEADDAELITAEAAERRVLDHEAETRGQTLTIMEGRTREMILPVILDVDDDENDNISRYVWVVYTDNPESGIGRSSDLPYLAHYVTLTGEYLYALPTIMPGDEAGEAGFDASYVFEFMEPVDYVGFVDLSTGGEQELTVTVMRDRRTGMYYLGNLERRIVVADCYEFLYGGGQVVLESSRDNLQWDQVGLLSLYNYCRAYDYYKEIGWSGGDGLDTPILILNNYCDANRTPVNNAAYVGKYLGWQIFLASQANDYSQCLDVLGHEFTHCVTDSVMTYNAYMNDFGAINEAMSDIQGKTCQMLTEGKENVTWELGDRSEASVRDMSEPHRYQQPDFSWDIYYMPNVKTPNVLNDEGGVHTNSSLLNRLAWMLYEKGGMTPEEGRAFWFTVDCAMVPGTDYPQLAELLPWALRATGLEKYETELRRGLDATRLGINEIPDAFDDDRALVTLTLPDTETFADEQWVMQLLSVDVGTLIDLGKDLILQVMAGDYSDLPTFVQELLAPDVPEPEVPVPDEFEPESVEPEETDGEGLWAALLEALLNGDREDAPEASEGEVEPEDDTDWLKTQLTDWAMAYFKGVFYYGTTDAGQDGRTMRIVSIPGYGIPMLMHGVYNEETSDIDEFCAMVYVFDRWIDIGSLLDKVESADTGDGQLSEADNAMIEAFVDKLLSAHSLDDALDLLFFHIEGGALNELPATGLDEIQPQVLDMGDGTVDEVAAEPRLSRPKLDETQSAA